jgi:hypothetical protein
MLKRPLPCGEAWGECRTEASVASPQRVVGGVDVGGAAIVEHFVICFHA